MIIFWHPIRFWWEELRKIIRNQFFFNNHNTIYSYLVGPQGIYTRIYSKSFVFTNKNSTSLNSATSVLHFENIPSIPLLYFNLASRWIFFSFILRISSFVRKSISSSFDSSVYVRKWQATGSNCSLSGSSSFNYGRICGQPR